MGEGILFVGVILVCLWFLIEGDKLIDLKRKTIPLRQGLKVILKDTIIYVVITTTVILYVAYRSM